MLAKIRVQGFKCFECEELTLKNLNLFTGINSAGKSSMIQAILLLMQQKENVQNPLNGKYIQLGLIQDVKNTVTNAKKVEVSVEIEETKEKCQLELHADREFSSENMEAISKWDFIYLSAERMGVSDVYLQNLTDEYRIGTRGEYAFDYLSQNKWDPLCEPDFQYPKVGVNLGSQVDYWLDYIMGYQVTAERVLGTEVVRVSYSRKRNGSREVKPSHVGTGVSYIASVIVSALSCKKGSLFIIENPEIHLHPGAQSKLLEFLSFLAARGLQIIVETHSDHIFNGLRKSMKQKRISAEQERVYFFKLDEHYLSRPVFIKIDENGIIKNYEKGFFDQFDEDLDDLLGL